MRMIVVLGVVSIKLVVVGTSGRPRVDFDAIAVVGAEAVPPTTGGGAPPPTTGGLPTLPNTQTGSGAPPVDGMAPAMVPVLAVLVGLLWFAWSIRRPVRRSGR